MWNVKEFQNFSGEICQQTNLFSRKIRYVSSYYCIQLLKRNNILKFLCDPIVITDVITIALIYCMRNPIHRVAMKYSNIVS